MTNEEQQTRCGARPVLSGWCLFAIDGPAFEAFAAALDRPPAENARLRRLLTTPAPWKD